jgi:hypothetical protein
MCGGIMEVRGLYVNNPIWSREGNKRNGITGPEIQISIN